MTRTHCLNTKTCSCYYLAACCKKKSNISWSERKNGPINLPSGPPALGYSSERQKQTFLSSFSTIFLPRTFTQMYGANCKSWDLAFPFYLKAALQRALGGQLPGKREAQDPCHPRATPCRVPHLAPLSALRAPLHLENRHDGGEGGKQEHPPTLADVHRRK